MKKREMKNWLVLSSVSVALMVACGKSASAPGKPVPTVDDPNAKVAVKDESKAFESSITDFQFQFNPADQTMQLDMIHNIAGAPVKMPSLKGKLGNITDAKNNAALKARLLSDDKTTQDYTATVVCKTDLKTDPNCSNAIFLIRKAGGDLKGAAVVSQDLMALPGVSTPQYPTASSNATVASIQSIYMDKNVTGATSLLKLVTVRNGSSLYALAISFKSKDDTEERQVSFNGVMGADSMVTLVSHIKAKNEFGKDISADLTDSLKASNSTYDLTSKRMEIVFDELDVAIAPTDDIANSTSTSTGTGTGTGTAASTSTNTGTPTGTSTGTATPTGTSTSTPTGTGTGTGSGTSH